jgi:hydroxymethylbilane synthase
MVDTPDMHLVLGSVDDPIGQWQMDRVFDLLCREAPHHELDTVTCTGLNELLEALVSGSIDVATCAVDALPASLPDGVKINAWLPRGQVEEMLLGCSSLDALPTTAPIVADGLLRRAQILERCPNAQVQNSSGDIVAALARLDAGEVSAMVVPRWELIALCQAYRESVILDPEDFLPSPGQGVTAVLVRSDSEIHERITKGMSHAATRIATQAELASAAKIDGLVGVVSTLAGEEITMLVKTIDPDGTDARLLTETT